MQYDLNHPVIHSLKKKKRVPMVPGASEEALRLDGSRREETPPPPGDEDAPPAVVFVSFDTAETVDQEEYSPVTLEAHSLVFGDRQADYGHPLDDFSRTAHYWTGHLRDILIPGAEIVAEDVGPMMCLLKLSRQRNFRKRDNMTDTCGYAETTERVIHERARRARLAAKGKKDASSV